MEVLQVWWGQILGVSIASFKTILFSSSLTPTRHHLTHEESALQLSLCTLDLVAHSMAEIALKELLQVWERQVGIVQHSTGVEETPWINYSWWTPG